MILLMRVKISIAAVSVVLLISCQRELNEILQEAEQCKIQTGYYYGGSGGINDSSIFTYDGAGKLVKLTNRDGKYLYYYSGNNIQARKYTDALSNEVLFLDSVWYAADGSITKLASYDFSGWYTDSIAYDYLFGYLNNKLTDLTIVEKYTDYTGTPISDSFPVKFSWNAAGNMEKVVYYDNYGAYDSALYQFDTNPNYFKIVHPHFFLFDPMFQLQVGLEAHFPYFYSKNNVTNINIYGSYDNPIVYGLDTPNRMTAVNMAGFEYVKYKYQCE